MPRDIRLGSEVKDLASGCAGIVTARIEYMNGCTQYSVQPAVTKDNVLPDSYWFDWQRLEVTGPGITQDVRNDGGPPPSGRSGTYSG